MDKDYVRGVLLRNPDIDIVRIAQVIEDMLLIAEGSIEGEWEGQVRYLPLE